MELLRMRLKKLGGPLSSRDVAPIVLMESVAYACRQALARCGFDLTSRDADVSQHTIVELMELADGAAQGSFSGQVGRQPDAPQAESA
jgi:hypothetical protein